METIIKYSFKEMVKKKIFIATLVLAVIFLILYGGALYLVYDRGGGPTDLVIRAAVSSQLLGAGFYFSTFIVAFLTVLGSISTVTNETESGLLYTILTKPIARPVYLLGKYLGLACMMTAFGIFMLGMVLMINIFFAGEFLYDFSIFKIIQAVAVYSLIPLCLLSVVFFLGMKLKSLATGIIVIMLFMLGVIGGFLEQIGVVLGKQELVDVGIFTSLLSPMDSLYRKFFSILYDTGNMSLSLIANGPFGTGQPPSGWMVIYAGVFTAVFLLLAIAAFNKLDL
ncbi:MAG: ABC transporter permease [Peptococcaceae bacterium]